jgi:hypothetical protein
MVDIEDPSRELRHVVILVQAFALVQCSADHCIALSHVTAGVLVSRIKIVRPFYSSRVDFTVGTRLLLGGGPACCF